MNKTRHNNHFFNFLWMTFFIFAWFRNVWFFLGGFKKKLDSILVSFIEFFFVFNCWILVVYYLFPSKRCYGLICSNVRDTNNLWKLLIWYSSTFHSCSENVVFVRVLGERRGGGVKNQFFQFLVKSMGELGGESKKESFIILLRIFWD